jgi:hypothetical protein
MYPTVLQWFIVMYESEQRVKIVSNSVFHEEAVKSAEANAQKSPEKPDSRLCWNSKKRQS